MRLRNKVLTGTAAAMAMTIGAVVMLTDSSVQSQINSANCGDVITLEAGRAYVENIALPVKPCTDTSYITIQSSRAAELPEGKRVSPAQAALFAKLQSNVNAEPVIKTAPGAHHYKFIGVQISTASATVAVYDLVRFGDSRQTQKTLAQAPHHLIIDRSYILGWPTQDVQRGVSLQCASCDVINSHISDIHAVGVEAQAIAGWNGPGPFRIINNYLEAAGENVMFGGADSAATEWDANGKPINGLMPAGLEMRGNYLFKPLSWKVGHPTYAGKHWTVKNLLELKAMRGAVIDGNVFENNWVDGQDGSGILFTVRNQECTAPWSTVQDITYTNNTAKGIAGAALNFLGVDNEATIEYINANPDKCRGFDPAKLGSVRGTKALIANNLFHDISGAFLQLNGFPDVTVTNNTHLQSCTEGCNTMTLFGDQSPRLIYRDNVTQEKPYGIFGDGGVGGKAALDKFAPGWVFSGNVVATPYDNQTVTGNQYVAALAITSDFRTPHAGKGADIDKLLAAQAGVISGPIPTPSVQPSVSPSPSATATSTPTPATPTPTVAPVPSPTATATPTPRPSPSPCPPVRFPNLPTCVSNQFVGDPVRCVCGTGIKNNLRCR